MTFLVSVANQVSRDPIVVGQEVYIRSSMKKGSSVPVHAQDWSSNTGIVPIRLILFAVQSTSEANGKITVAISFTPSSRNYSLIVSMPSIFFYFDQ